MTLALNPFSNQYSLEEFVERALAMTYHIEKYGLRLIMLNSSTYCWTDNSLDSRIVKFQTKNEAKALLNQLRNWGWHSEEIKIVGKAGVKYVENSKSFSDSVSGRPANEDTL